MRSISSPKPSGRAIPQPKQHTFLTDSRIGSELGYATFTHKRDKAKLIEESESDSSGSKQKPDIVLSTVDPTPRISKYDELKKSHYPPGLKSSPKAEAEDSRASSFSRNKRKTRDIFKMYKKEMDQIQTRPESKVDLTSSEVMMSHRSSAKQFEETKKQKTPLRKRRAAKKLNAHYHSNTELQSLVNDMKNPEFEEYSVEPQVDKGVLPEGIHIKDMQGLNQPVSEELVNIEVQTAGQSLVNESSIGCSPAYPNQQSSLVLTNEVQTGPTESSIDQKAPKEQN